MSNALRNIRHVAKRSLRCSSTTSEPAPPLLLKIRDDLKTAMRSKDKPRLNVLRAILSDAANASKGSSPIKTDLQVLALLNKKIAGSKAASEQFAQANRDDLKQKQDAELAVMDEYAGQVETTDVKDLSEAVEEAYRKLKESTKFSAGLMMRELLGPGGTLAGKPVEKSQLAQMVQDMLKSKT